MLWLDGNGPNEAMWTSASVRAGFGLHVLGSIGSMVLKHDCRPSFCGPSSSHCTNLGTSALLASPATATQSGPLGMQKQSCLSPAKLALAVKP